jgi:hypothetical protein
VTEGKSAWAYVGTGCVMLALIAAVLVAGGSFWLYRSARKFERGMTDPVARAARVREVLGAEDLPEGYHEVMAFRIPFLVQVAILSGGDGESGLIYVQALDQNQDRRALRDYFEGKTSDPAVLAENQIKVEIDEIIGRGIVPGHGATLLYLAQRGKIEVEGFHGEGILALALVDCPDDPRNRMAIWFAPDPAPDLPVAETDLSGTPADPEALAAFMGHFRLCRASPE